MAIIDVVDTYRELIGGLMEVYLPSIANRQNEALKVRTIVGSIFITLTFLAGVDWMHSESMPELHFTWGYPLLLTILVTVGLGMTVYFKKEGCLGAQRNRPTESGQCRNIVWLMKIGERTSMDAAKFIIKAL